MFAFECCPEDTDEVAFRIYHWHHPVFPFMVCSHAEIIGPGRVIAEFYPWPWKLGEQ